jgi:hypothetical protein
LPRYRFLEAAAEIERVTCSVVNDIIIDLRGHGVNASFLQELRLLTVSGGLTIAVAVARAVSDGTRKSRRWEVRKLKYKKADLTLLIRMDSGNRRIMDYFLLPTAVLPLSKDRQKMRVSDRLYHHMRLDTFEAVMTALYGRLHSSRAEQPEFRFRPTKRDSRTSHDAQAKPRQPIRSPSKGRLKEGTGHARR